jgi:hypothetical protein
MHLEAGGVGRVFLRQLDWRSRSWKRERHCWTPRRPHHRPALQVRRLDPPQDSVIGIPITERGKIADVLDDLAQRLTTPLLQGVET